MDAAKEIEQIVKDLTPQHAPLMTQLKLFSDVRVLIEQIRQEARDEALSVCQTVAEAVEKAEPNLFRLGSVDATSLHRAGISAKQLCEKHKAKKET